MSVDIDRHAIYKVPNVITQTYERYGTAAFVTFRKGMRKPNFSKLPLLTDPRAAAALASIYVLLIKTTNSKAPIVK